MGNRLDWDTWILKKNLECMVEILEKGAAKRLAPATPTTYGAPPKILGSQLQSWMVLPRAKVRDNIPEVTPAGRFRLMNKLSNHTLSRLNPVSKQREVLLHRGMSPREKASHNKGSVNSLTSWSPNLNVAKDFAREYNGSVASAWIPESQIHNSSFSSPLQFTDRSDRKIERDMQLEEREVFVKPHTINYETDANIIAQGGNRFNAAAKENIDLQRDSKSKHSNKEKAFYEEQRKGVGRNHEKYPPNEDNLTLRDTEIN